MDKKWAAAETELWEAIFRRSTRRVKLHSLPPGEQNKARQELEEQREKEFAAGWRAYEAWLRH